MYSTIHFINDHSNIYAENFTHTRAIRNHSLNIMRWSNQVAFWALLIDKPQPITPNHIWSPHNTQGIIFNFLIHLNSMFLLDHSANVMIFTHMSHQLNELHNLHVDTTCTCNKPKKTCEFFFIPLSFIFTTRVFTFCCMTTKL